MYKLKEITDKKSWNIFVGKNKFSFYSFLQSWEWWEVQKLEWKFVFRYFIFYEEKIVWIIQIIKVIAKRWNYFFIPHWPLIIEELWFFQVFSWILFELKNKAKEEKVCFIRLNSPIKNLIKNKKEFKKLWFINAPMHEHAEDTHLLDLKPEKSQLLANMDKKDRYYITRAEKEGVIIRIDNKEDHIKKLIEMHYNHAKKTGYKKFGENFIKNLYKVFENNINTISASYNWNIESILMTIKFQKVCVYYISASDIKNPKFSPNYLCQWEAIKNAKNSLCEIYNFWWVSPDDNPKHPIAWVTKFKRKFCWYDYSLLHAQDLPLNKRYFLNYIVESIRRMKRGYYYKKPE